MISREGGTGDAFKLLGLTFDTALRMEATIHDLVTASRWKMKQLFRMHRMLSSTDLVTHYKSQILTKIAYATAGIYHASATALEPLDKRQVALLMELGITQEAAFSGMNVAPLCTRRDIAMLGVIHRAVLGEGPEQFQIYIRLAETPGESRTWDKTT